MIKLIEGSIHGITGDANKIMQLISAAILDNKIPITKIVGIYVSNRGFILNSFSRGAFLEPILEIIHNLSKLVYVNPLSLTAVCKLDSGKISAEEAEFYSGGYKIYPICKKEHIITVFDRITLGVAFRKSIGVHSMEENSDYLTRTSNLSSINYTPYFSSHSISHLFSIKPKLLNGNIQYSCSKDVDITIIENLLNEYFKGVAL